MSLDQQIESKVANPPSDDDELDFAELWGTIANAKWLIFGVVFTMVFLASVYNWIATPVYQSDVLIQVESKKSGLGDLGDLPALMGGNTPAEAEVEIIRSRSIVSQAVERLNLDIYAEAVTFPIIGRAIARRHNPADGLREPLFGLAEYAWGGEIIRVTRLDLGPADVRVGAASFLLVAGEEGGYELFDGDGIRVLEGMVGAQAAGASGYPKLFVANLVARPGTHFRLAKSSSAATTESIRKSLQVGEKGRRTGIVEMSMLGTDRKELVTLLDTIAAQYVRQNVERNSEEARKTLAFLETQLPKLRLDLQAAEERLNAYRARLGSVDTTLETEATLERLAHVERSLSELELNRSELQEKYTAQHPAMLALEQKRRQLEAEKAALDRQIKQMPDEVQEAVRLTRDVRVNDALYTLLLDKVQELKVVKAGTIGNVRIIDGAYLPARPVKPKKVLVLLGSVLFGLILGVIIVFVRRALYHGVEDPDLVERTIGLPVYASIPHSDVQDKAWRKGRLSRRDANQVRLLASLDSQDLALESLRSLRTSLQFAMLDAGNNVVSITGPGPSIGKSFVSANLAQSIAESGKRTLLIDADMRKGHLHDYFGLAREGGLSQVITGEYSLDDAIHPNVVENLSFLATGIVPPNPSELLMSPKFEAILRQAAEHFDLVLVDTPPILAVTDAAIIGRLAAINFVLLRAGLHHIKEIEYTIKRLRQNGVNPQGFVLNDVARRPGRYGYGYSYGKYSYHYQYSYK